MTERVGILRPFDLARMERLRKRIMLDGSRRVITKVMAKKQGPVLSPFHSSTEPLSVIRHGD